MLSTTSEQYNVAEKCDASIIAQDGCRDTFRESRRAGKVISSRTSDGVLRRGIDIEGVIGIDNGALRIQPLIQPGWGRAGIAYGPYRRQNGLAFAAFLLNGHNTAQSENLPDNFLERLDRWWRGSDTYGKRRRLYQWICSGRKMRMVRQLKWWWRSHRDTASVQKIDENLALGWFSGEVPSNPVADGNTFVMHATGPDNGELWTRVGSRAMPTIRGVQNLQTYYVIILREKGAAYYAASLPDAHGFSAYPYLRPLAVDPFNDNMTVYAALYQSVLGQIGFRLDTRVYGVQISQLAELSNWYGTAHAADQLTGSGLLDRSNAEKGGAWCVSSGRYERTQRGARPTGTDNLAVIDPGAPSGLVHALVEPGAASTAAVSILWRVQNKDNFWSLFISDKGCQLSVKVDGICVSVSSSEKWRLKSGEPNAVQILDDGQTFGLYLQGQLLFDSWITDSRLQDATGVGIYTINAESELYIRSFEAHPRSVRLPSALDLGSPWLRKGARVIVGDEFSGPVRDLAGKATSVGNKMWKREIGTGVIEVVGNGSARIQGSVQNPSPGRTAYTIDWDCPEFADLEVTITPPGTGRGQKEHGLSGFILWQDEHNYITINIWVSDEYGGASISCFFHLNGFEDLYDAIWSNVGSRVYWGIPCRLRLVFDGMNYTAFVDDEPVLYRTLTDVYPDCQRFVINRVGLIANWEWGNDTGSVFNDFVGRV